MTIQISALSEMEKRNTENLVWTFQDELKELSEGSGIPSVIPSGTRKRMVDYGILESNISGTLSELGIMLLEASYEAGPEASLFEFAGLEVQTDKNEVSPAPGEPIVIEPPESWASLREEDPGDLERESSETTEASQLENESPRTRAPRPPSVADKIPRDKLKQLIDEELSIEEIVENLDVSRRSVRRYAKKYGLKLPQRNASQEKQSVDLGHQVLNEPLMDPCSLKLEELIESYLASAELYNSYGQEIQRRLSLLQEVA